MKHIHYVIPPSSFIQDGYVVYEDKSWFTPATPLLVSWLTSIDRLDEIEDVDLPKLEKTICSMYPLPDPGLPPIPSWMVDFPLDEFDSSKWAKVSNFFEHYLLGNGSTVSRLEGAVRACSFLLTKEEQNVILRYMKREVLSEKDRLRALLSSELAPYL